MKFNWKSAYSAFRLLGSLTLAVLLIIVLAIVFAVGTFIESHYGTQTAQILVYRTPWLTFLLFLLALNLLASALDRWPWKKKHIGFVTTHLGIILILLGSMVTQLFGVEGQIAIREGESESKMTRYDHPLLQIFSSEGRQEWTYLLDTKPFNWTGENHLKAVGESPLSVKLLKYYPKAELVHSVEEAEDGSPAILVSIKGMMADWEEWLFLEDPARSSYDFGPSKVSFAAEKIAAEPPVSAKLGKLVFTLPDETKAEIPIEKEGETVPLPGTSIQVQIARVIRDGVVDQNRLVDRSDNWNNPAVEFQLISNGTEERHISFAQFPEFPTVHGFKSSEMVKQIRYVSPEGQSAGAGRELHFVYEKGSLPVYQIKNEDHLEEGTIEVGKPVETGWMDFTFTVEKYLENGKIVKRYEPLSAGSKKENAYPVLQIQVSSGEDQTTLWAPQGEAQLFRLGPRFLHAYFGYLTQPLGFKLMLEDFILETDPGTNQPAAYKSKVKLLDTGKGIQKDVLIQMNEPLAHRGFKIFQTAYKIIHEGADISIFTAARDPGIPLKYLGSIIMVGGIIVLFFVPSLSTMKSSDPKTRK